MPALPTRLVSRLGRQAGALLHGRTPGSELVHPDAPSVSTRALLTLVVVAGAFYGACMALYGARWGTAYGLPHVLAAMVKVPLLFLFTLAVTAPSLHVFAALARSQLAFGQTVRLLLAASALSLVVLASFAPVTVFFTFCTRSHPFLQLLNATFFTVAGLVGMRCVRMRLSEALAAQVPERVARTVDAGRETQSERTSRSAPKLVFVCGAWFVVYGGVAAQMGWLLRPFVGAPNRAQVLLRETEGNVFGGLVDALRFVFE